MSVRMTHYCGCVGLLGYVSVIITSYKTLRRDAIMCDVSWTSSITFSTAAGDTPVSSRVTSSDCKLRRNRPNYLQTHSCAHSFSDISSCSPLLICKKCEIEKFPRASAGANRIKSYSSRDYMKTSLDVAPTTSLLIYSL